MATQGFLAIVGNAVKNVTAVISGGGNAALAGQIPALGPDGRLDIGFMASGVGANTGSFPATEALAAGAMVNIYANAANNGVMSARNADSTAANGGKLAQGFVQGAVASGATATVYFSGQNTGVSGLTPGVDYFLGSAGAVSVNGDTAAGHSFQRVGFTTAAGDLVFQPGLAIQC